MNLNRLYTEIILVSVLLLTACHKIAPVLYRIPLSEGIEHAALFDAGDYIDSVDYVLLETNDSCWIGDVYKIIPYRNFYYIRDLHENLFLFTDRGKFLRKIGKKEKGPGEYVTFTDFAVDPANGDVYLAALGKLMVYSMEGKLLRAEEIPFDWQVFAFAGQKHLVFIAPVPLEAQTPLLTICDKSGKNAGQIAGRAVACDLGYFNWIQEQSGRIYYKEEFSDTLFYIDELMNPHPYARIEWGNYKFQPAHFTMEKHKEWPEYYRINALFDFKGFMILNVQCGLMDQGLNTDAYVFDKASGKVGVFESNGEHSGLQIDGTVYGPKAAYGNRLIGIIPATELAGKTEIRNPELQKMICQMDENANPVLAVLYMKQLGEK